MFGTLQVKHTSGTVGDLNTGLSNKAQDLNVWGPECRSWDLNVCDPNVQDLNVLDLKVLAPLNN